MSRFPICALMLVLLTIFFHSGAKAQTQDQSGAEEPDFIVPSRPTVSNPAEFQRPGVLQLEFGYSANLHAAGVSIEQDMPVALRFAVSRRLLLEFDGDNPNSQTVDGIRATGWGDTQLGVQLVLRHENAPGPGVSFAYYVKLPSASRAKGLGTGRVGHSFIALLSKKIGDTTVDFNASYLVAGRTIGGGHASSGQGALAASYELTKRVGIQAEISGFSRNDAQAGAMYALGAVTYQLNRRLILDSGVHFGLSPDAARNGFFAGVTVGIADVYQHCH